MNSPGFSSSPETDGTAERDRPRRLAIWPWITLAVAIAIFVGYRLFNPPTPANRGGTHPAVGARIEHADLQPLTGNALPVTASDLHGKVTLINFWGPWCPPCRIEFPHVMEIEQHYRTDKNFQLLSISCSGRSGSDEEMGPTTEEFLAEFQADFATYRDPHQRLARHLLEVAGLESFVFPTSVVLDESGTIRGLWEGYAPGDEREIQAVLQATLRKMGKGG